MNKKERKAVKGVFLRMLLGLNKDELELLKEVLAEDLEKNRKSWFGF